MKITISYQTLHLPAPQAYAAVMKLETSADGLNVDLMIEYIGREALSPKEIEEEGYSQNDDYHWNGTLDKSWNDEALKLAQIKLESDPDDDIYIHFSIERKGDGFPTETQSADLYFQELLQSIIETDGLESPLLLRVKLQKDIHAFEWHFASKTLTKDGATYNNWVWGRQLMNIIYSTDFANAKPTKKEQPFSVEIEGEWYRLPKAAVKAVEKLLDA